MKRSVLVGLMAAMMVGLVSFGHAGEAVEAGFGKIKATGLMQFWYFYQKNAAPLDTFRLRRAEIKLSGEISPMASWAVMFDPAQVREDDNTTVAGIVTKVGRKSVLQDFVITLKPVSGIALDLGQYKMPFGMEGLESSAKLDVIERSMITTMLKWSDARDMGVTAKGDFKIGDIKVLPTIGVFNGTGQNNLDNNNPVDMAARVAVRPTKALHFGVATFAGKSGAIGAEVENTRTGIEAKYAVDPIAVYGEYVTGKAATVNKMDYYATVAYKVLDKLQVVGRYDYYDTNTDVSSDAVTETTIGLNHFIEGNNAKVQLNYVMVGEEGVSVENDMVRLNVQVAY